MDIGPDIFNQTNRDPEGFREKIPKQKLNPHFVWATKLNYELR